MAYESAELNSDFFAPEKIDWLGYHESIRYFFTPERIEDGYSVLDVGGAGGAFCAAICEEVASIKPTIVDPDPRSIALGKRRYPAFEFIEGYFPEALMSGEKFDLVSVQGLFPQIAEWKEFLLALSRTARRYINLSLVLRLDGTTVVDKDTSYFYYLDSGERVHQVIHNIYELVNFLCIHEMNVKRIEFFGYRTPTPGHNFRCVPNPDQIKGNLMLELFGEGENPRRMGGASEKGVANPSYQFFIPEIDVVIDGKALPVR